MNYWAIRYIVGGVIALVALSMVIPLAFALILREGTAMSFVVPAALALAAGLLMRRGAKPGTIGIHEALIIVSGAWCAAALVGALPYWLSGTLPDPVDALFEAISGITTTGSSVVADIEALPRSFLVWRSLLNWLGGLGIIVLFVAVVPRVGFEGNQLFRAEMPGVTQEKLRPRIRESGRLLWLFYVALTVVLACLLWAAGLPLFDASMHALTTISTGGASTRNLSVGAFANPTAEWIIALFMFLGATNFTLLYRCVLHGEFAALVKNREFQAYVAVVLIAAGLMAGDLAQTGMGASVSGRAAVESAASPVNVGDTVRAAVFQAVSVVSTTGFVSTGNAAWPTAASTILFLLMFTSGMAGSTAGGPKMIRIAIAVKYGFLGVLKLLHPRSVTHLRLGELKISEQVAAAVGSFLFLYMLIFAVSCVVLSFAGADPATTATAVIASLGNVGHGFGIAGPFPNLAIQPAWVKLYLCLLMLIGRLEIYSVLVLFLPSFWSRK